MPSQSKKQHNFMEAIAHNKAFAKKVHIPQKVGEDFVEADKGKTFRRGGNMATRKTLPINPAMAAMAGRAMRTPAIAAPVAPAAAPMPTPGAMPGMKHGGLSKEHHKHLAHHHLSMAEHHMHMHTHGGKTKKYAGGGSIKEEASSEKRGHMKGKETMGPRNIHEDIEKGSNKLSKFGESKVQKRGHTEDREPKMKGNDIGTGAMVNTKKHGGHIKKMASGGSTSSRADGMAKRGHTKTKYC